MILSFYIITMLTKIQEEHINKIEQGVHIGTWQEKEGSSWETFRRFQKSDLLMINQAIKFIIHKRNASR